MSSEKNLKKSVESFAFDLVLDLTLDFCLDNSELHCYVSSLSLYQPVFVTEGCILRLRTNVTNIVVIFRLRLVHNLHSIVQFLFYQDLEYMRQQSRIKTKVIISVFLLYIICLIV